MVKFALEEAIKTQSLGGGGWLTPRPNRFTPFRYSIPGPPTCSESPYRLSYPGPKGSLYTSTNNILLRLLNMDGLTGFRHRRKF